MPPAFRSTHLSVLRNRSRFGPKFDTAPAHRPSSSPSPSVTYTVTPPTAPASRNTSATRYSRPATPPATTAPDWGWPSSAASSRPDRPGIVLPRPPTWHGARTLRVARTVSPRDTRRRPRVGVRERPSDPRRCPVRARRLGAERHALPGRRAGQTGSLPAEPRGRPASPYRPSNRDPGVPSIAGPP